MTLDELVGQLQVAEDADVEDDPAAKGGSSDQLLLTRAQWDARSRRRGGVGRRDDGDHGGDRDDDDTSSSTSSGRGGSRYQGWCFECGRRRHLARECPKKKVLFAGVDEEPTLL
jgi:hypothetical protein